MLKLIDGDDGENDDNTESDREKYAGDEDDTENQSNDEIEENEKKRLRGYCCWKAIRKAIRKASQK